MTAQLHTSTSNELNPFAKAMAEPTAAATATSGSTAPRRFDIKKPNIFTHYDIYAEGSNTMLHYVEISNFTNNKPDLTLHEGSDTNGPVLAVSHMPKTSADYKVGLGDPHAPATSPTGTSTGILWENMEKKSNNANHYEMVFPLEDGSRWKLAWKRTHEHAVDNKEISKMSMRDWKLVDVETGRIVALFTNERWSVIKTGTVQINGDFGKGFDELVFVTVLSLYEKIRRRHQRGAWYAHGVGAFG